MFNSSLWSDRVTVKRTTGFAPYYLRFGQDCILPVEVTVGSWNSPVFDSDEMSTDDLLAMRIVQLSDYRLKLEQGYEKLIKEKQKNVEYFEELCRARKEELKVNDLVLLENTRVRMGMGKKLDPFWFGPYRVVKVVGNGLYQISELDGSVLKEEITGNRLIHYKIRQGTNLSGLKKYVHYEVDEEASSDDESDDEEEYSEEEESHVDDEEVDVADGSIGLKNTEKGLDGVSWRSFSCRA